MESMGDPVEELREAVEMLNDTVRERGRSQSHDQAIHELLSKVRRWESGGVKLSSAPGRLHNNVTNIAATIGSNDLRRY